VKNSRREVASVAAMTSRMLAIHPGMGTMMTQRPLDEYLRTHHVTQRIRLVSRRYQARRREWQLLVDVEFAPGTMTRYETARKHVESFLQWKYANVPNIA
jgi:hypothetical protein